MAAAGGPFITMSLEHVFAEVFSIPQEQVTDLLQLDQIASWDSLSHMMLIGRLEDEFKVQLSGDEIADLRSVADARRALLAHGAAV